MRGSAASNAVRGERDASRAEPNAERPFSPVLPFPHIPHRGPAISTHGVEGVARRETHTWGYSSVARAVALQAIGLGFKSPYLQRTRSLTTQGKGEEERVDSAAREAE
jgi:hypothetical protein